jgi:Big-like domain-containing protein
VVQHDGNGNATPADGASVGGQITGSNGQASVSFASPGVQRFKATKSGAIRSNAQEVCVEDPGSGSCSGFKPTVGAAPEPDQTRPVSRVTGLRSGKHYRLGPRTLRGKASDRGLGLRDVRLRLNWIARKGCRFYDGKLERFTSPGTCRDARFFSVGDKGEWSYVLPERLARGRYSLTVKAVDKAGNFDVERVRFAVTR